MIEFYPQVKAVHVWCAVLSVALFAARGAMHLAKLRFANHIALRATSWTIDTTLLTAALMLATMLRQYPFVHGWLTVKVLLLVAYIVLGTCALKRARTTRGRALAYVAALGTFALIAAVARSHDPLGPLRGFFG
jgi:uncharacterized membrane protein SirB2